MHDADFGYGLDSFGSYGKDSYSGKLDNYGSYGSTNNVKFGGFGLGYGNNSYDSDNSYGKDAYDNNSFGANQFGGFGFGGKDW